jgi:hypothetical protein
MYIKDQHECNTKIYIPALKQISPTNRIGGIMVSMPASAASVIALCVLYILSVYATSW